MRLWVLTFAALSLMLAACGKPAELAMNEAVVAGAAAGGEGERVATEASADMAAAPATSQPVVPVGVPMLAYAYDYGVRASPKAVRALMARHEAACVKAGPTVCQVTGSSVNEQGDDQVMAVLSMRAAPAWLTRFRSGIDQEAKDAGGRLVRAAVTSEDLSRQIVDTEAMLRARTTLRDRLQALLASRPGKLADLIELERELARVQGELDSAQSQLTVMRQRVATSQIEVTYQSAGVLAPQGVWSPLATAFSDVIGIVAYTLGGLVRFVAWTAPWVVILGGLAWVFRKRIPRWRQRKETPPPQS